MVLSIMYLRSAFARSTTNARLLIRTSSIFVTFSLALHGPMRWMISSAAPTIAVSALSSDEGIMISPAVFPPLVSTLTSILPILPDRWSSRSSKSAPRRPSVWPKMAPMTSGRSTTPSISIVACTMYFADTGLIFAIVITLCCCLFEGQVESCGLLCLVPL